MQTKAKSKKQKAKLLTETAFFSLFRRRLRSTFYVLRSRTGFTLVETLVAIAILLLAIGGPLTIAAQSFFAARFSKDSLTATYLAQEGIELVRYRRDSNSLAGNGWMEGLDSCLDGNKCMISAVNNNWVGSCGVGVCNPLKKHATAGVYAYNSNFVETKFIREITIEEIADTEIIVTSIVRWANGSVEREVELKENLHNWR